MGNKKYVEENYTYEECIEWIMFGTYDAYVERSQWPKT